MTKHTFVALCILLGLLPVLATGDAQPTADAPLAPELAARSMLVPEGFQVTLFAGEPDVKQPIGFCIDDRGRLWVAEAYNYPNHGTTPGDRILIFEDGDGDGRFDTRKVFYDGLNYVTGIEVGFGGAWVMSPPSFYFIPDRDGDDRPDGPAEVLLDGFGNHANAHNLANGFAWGPDGWLYGTHGRTNWSLLGKPGTPEDERIRFDGGVYRYHPVRHVWEPYADGTTNPWGIDWDDFGQAFVCNCVNPHLFHVIQGAHYEPWRNRESSRYAYERIPTIADHLHFIGTENVRDGLGTPEEDASGGGHAHCGTMVYLGDNWPERYRNTVFMNNIHGRRINNDALRREGSGYTASHAPDLMRSQDSWFMGVTLAYGPDGSVYVSDWSDTGECHSVRNTRRHTGRIYRISYGQPETRPVELAKLTDEELVELQLHRNDWFVRHARRLLQERAAAGQDMQQVHDSLHRMYAERSDVTRQLRALWALHVTGGLDDDFLVQQLSHANEHVRAWAVKLLCEDCNPPSAALERFVSLARDGDSPLVRLHLASALQRLPVGQRWPIAEALAGREEDRTDANLPLMLWYGIEPLVKDDIGRFVALAERARIPLIRRHIARRVTEASDLAGLTHLVRLLADAKPPTRRDLLQGSLQGLEGRAEVEMPESWPAVYARLRDSESDDVRRGAVRLALIFNDPDALQALWEQTRDVAVDASIRQEALSALVATRQDELAPLLLTLVSDPVVQIVAMQGLAQYNHPATAETIVDLYKSMEPTARRHALQLLASRVDWGHTLLDAVESGRIARSDVDAFTARQLHSLDNPRISARLTEVWGEVRATPEQRRRLIERLRGQLTRKTLADADHATGHRLFQKHCADCHRLFGEGGTVGPDLTGAQRTNLDYLLENLVDPSAAVSRDFQMEVIQTESGRVITGLVASETENAVTLLTVNERVVVPVEEIAERQTSRVSMMPDGIIQQLNDDEVRDLVAFLMNPQKAGLPVAEPDDAEHH